MCEAEANSRRHVRVVACKSADRKKKFSLHCLLLVNVIDLHEQRGGRAGHVAVLGQKSLLDKRVQLCFELGLKQLQLQLQLRQLAAQLVAAN